jgi:hypothetical protein
MNWTIGTVAVCISFTLCYLFHSLASSENKHNAEVLLKTSTKQLQDLITFTGGKGRYSLTATYKTIKGYSEGRMTEEAVPDIRIMVNTTVPMPAEIVNNEDTEV